MDEFVGLERLHFALDRRGSGATIVALLRVDAPYDEHRLRDALNRCSRRLEALHARIVESPAPRFEPTEAIVQIGDTSTSIGDAMHAAFTESFVGQSCLWSVRVVEREESFHVVFAFSHVIADGVSIVRFVHSLRATYLGQPVEGSSSRSTMSGRVITYASRDITPLSLWSKIRWTLQNPPEFVFKRGHPYQRQDASTSAFVIDQASFAGVLERFRARSRSLSATLGAIAAQWLFEACPTLERLKINIPIDYHEDETFKLCLSWILCDVHRPANRDIDDIAKRLTHDFRRKQVDRWDRHFFNQMNGTRTWLLDKIIDRGGIPTVSVSNKLELAMPGMGDSGPYLFVTPTMDPGVHISLHANGTHVLFGVTTTASLSAPDLAGELRSALAVDGREYPTQTT